MTDAEKKATLMDEGEVAQKVVDEKGESTIDKRYHLLESGKAKEIIERAMNLAREEIPKGAVATYIPEL